MKYLPWIHRGILLTLISLVIGGVVYFHTTVDPLITLERAVQAVVYVETGYRSAPGVHLYWQAQRLEHVLSFVNGATITYGPLADSYGVTNTQTRQIHIDDTLSWNGRFEVLTHEAGHLLQPGRLNSVEAEVFAEGVSYLVLRHYKHDRLELHAHYLSSRKAGLHVLREFATDIRYAAQILTVR